MGNVSYTAKIFIATSHKNFTHALSGRRPTRRLMDGIDGQLVTKARFCNVIYRRASERYAERFRMQQLPDVARRSTNDPLSTSDDTSMPDAPNEALTSLVNVFRRQYADKDKDWTTDRATDCTTDPP